MRICKSKENEEVGISSEEEQPICFGNDEFGFLCIHSDKNENDWANINKDSPFNYPAETDIQKDTEGSLNFGGGEDSEFKAQYLEVYKLNFN